ncbi:siderophore-interacting protein [Isoptericola sp. S6320L]|uniref:siderophore-interacting protein n=1 Tax=Isoptericola sp. S6320L TaxID=2926411 RepID=UPI001FF677D7|nr:siderophore-interacting protein [Isoptericola sp. S6320L]MCK0117760.1 siderophore-interacting protein [Isoptericola sp. S6320L]
MFSRPRTPLDLIPRRVRVHAVRQLTGSMVRTTFRDVDGADPAAPSSLAALRAPGPDDHVKVFLPDPATGRLHPPTVAADGGIQRPAGVVSISRELTVRAQRTVDGVAEADVDWVLHGDDGPASAWASRAAVGDEVVLVGPSVSTGVPDGVDRLTVVVDETGLPAAARWVAALGPDVRATAVVEIGDDVDESFVEAELGHADVEILYRTDGPGQLAEAVRSLGGLEDGELLVALGEAGELVPVRRHLRYEAGTRPDQLVIAGYWRRGTVNLDHDQPLDPADPD